MSHVSQITFLALIGCLVGCTPASSAETAAHPATVGITTPALDEAPNASPFAVELRIDAGENDTATAHVRVRALRASAASLLTLRTDAGVEVTGETATELTPMAAGEQRDFTIALRGRTGPVGRRVFATVTVRGAHTVDADGAMAWAFGPADPARVLPRSGATLGPNGVGELGPGERVLVTPAGERLHDSRVR